MDNNKLLKVIEGIGQAAANAFDGALDKDGKPIKIGLRRENGHVINSSRLIDGFKVKINADTLFVTYQSEMKIKETHNSNFENEQVQRIENAVKWLKEEYNRITGDNLSLKMVGKPLIKVNYVSQIKTWCEGQCAYKINNITVDVESPYPKNDKAQNFTKLGIKNKK